MIFYLLTFLGGFYLGYAVCYWDCVPPRKRDSSWLSGDAP